MKSTRLYGLRRRSRNLWDKAVKVRRRQDRATKRGDAAEVWRCEREIKALWGQSVPVRQEIEQLERELYGAEEKL